MGFPVKICAVCGEEFELKPDKPAFANRCMDCSVDDEADAGGSLGADAFEDKAGVNAARREAMRDLLYRKDS